ncbi:MAG: hypothetical protein ABIP30_16110 [Ferruginibacter sp.]
MGIFSLIIKVATNSPFGTRMRDIIDIDFGQIVRGKRQYTNGRRHFRMLYKSRKGEVIPKAVQ